MSHLSFSSSAIEILLDLQSPWFSRIVRAWLAVEQKNPKVHLWCPHVYVNTLDSWRPIAGLSDSRSITVYFALEVSDNCCLGFSTGSKQKASCYIYYWGDLFWLLRTILLKIPHFQPTWQNKTRYTIHKQVVIGTCVWNVCQTLCIHTSLRMASNEGLHLNFGAMLNT